MLRALGLDLVLGGCQPTQASGVLAYESPFSLATDPDDADPSEDISAIALLQRTVADEGIPLAQRKLLEQQVAALVWVVRGQAYPQRSRT